MPIKILVKDNFLPIEHFNNLKNIMLSSEIPWFFQESVSDKTVNDGIYFTHTFHSHDVINSPFFDLLKPIFSLMNIKSLMRAKANLYPGSNKFIEHDSHKDYDFKHNAMVFSINTCDGYTKFSNGKKIKSVENRAVFFDGSLSHNSTNCTDEKARLNINFNYF